MRSEQQNASPEAKEDITFRSVAPDDLQPVLEICEADHVNRGTMRLPLEPRGWVEERIRHAQGIYKIVALRNEAVAGYAELVTFPGLPRHWHNAEINMIATHPDHRGAGVGQALMHKMIGMADNWLQIRRLTLYVWAGNDRAIRLYEEHGFRIEGTLPQFVFLDGAYADAHVMGRLAPAGAGG